MKYYKITNIEGKSWIIPKKNMRAGLMLYQPSSTKGKMFKRFFPLLYWIPLVRNLLHVEVCDLPLDDEINDYLKCVFNRCKLEYALFMGTPCKNQKKTIQIFYKNDILGYCKITKNKEIFKLFEREKQTLDYLNSIGIKNVPVCLDCRAIKNVYYTLVQSTIKTLGSTIKHKLSDKHLVLIEELANKTKVCVGYENSDFGKMIQSLSQHLNIFNDDDRKYLEKGINVVDEFYKDKTTFSFYHGDFTPWNTFEDKERLFVFDFEYASKSCPQYMDLFHFWGQVGILGKKLEVNELYKEYLKLLPILQRYSERTSILYISYLLYVFAFYNQIFDWHFPQGDIGYKSWIGQLKLILQQ